MIGCWDNSISRDPLAYLGVADFLRPRNPGNYPFVDPATGQPVGQFPITGGNRSGNLAISANAIDALLFPGASVGLAPGIFGLSRRFHRPTISSRDPRFESKERDRSALGPTCHDQERPARRHRNRAGISVPDAVRSAKAADGIWRSYRFCPGLTGSSTGAFPVTPTTPTAFETRNTGVTLEVEPVVGPDGVTIDLNLVPQVVEFEGFINYGSPIQSRLDVIAYWDITSSRRADAERDQSADLQCAQSYDQRERLGWPDRCAWRSDAGRCPEDGRSHTYPGRHPDRRPISSEPMPINTSNGTSSFSSRRGWSLLADNRSIRWKRKKKPKV